MNTLFFIIHSSKNYGFYSLANIAFIILIKKVLTLETGYYFAWERSSKSTEDKDISRDLLIITNGKNYACLPAPFLKNPHYFRALCKEEYIKPPHNRKTSGRFTSTAYEKLPMLQAKLKAVFSGSIQKVLQQYFASPTLYQQYRHKSTISTFKGKGDCMNCIHFDSSSNSCKRFENYPDSILCPLFNFKQTLVSDNNQASLVNKTK